MKSNIKSPLSLNASARLIETYETGKLREDWLNAFGIDISVELKGAEKIYLYHCDESQLDFFLPESVAGSQELYKSLQKFDWFYMPEKWEFEEAIADLANCGSLLEIGCGQGFFIEKVLKYLKYETVKGIEYSEQAVKIALKKRLPVKMESLDDLVDRKEIFDTVCSFQVLEHISAPRPFLEKTLRVLKSGGDLVLCVPNKESFLKHQYNLLDMPPHHMTKWSLQTFKYLEKIFPLKLVKASFEPLAAYHIDGYMQAYSGYIRKKVPISAAALKIASIVIRATGLYKYCRGQSLYVRFRKL